MNLQVCVQKIEYRFNSTHFPVSSTYLDDLLGPTNFSEILAANRFSKPLPVQLISWISSTPGTPKNHSLMEGNGETNNFHVKIWNHPIETTMF